MYFSNTNVEINILTKGCLSKVGGHKVGLDVACCVGFRYMYSGRAKPMLKAAATSNTWGEQAEKKEGTSLA